MLAREPEPLETMQARYPLAIAEAFDPEALMLGTAPRPGEMRAHVFDFDDGLRLIISRDMIGGSIGSPIHVSASINPLSKLYEDLANVVKSHSFEACKEAFRDMASVAFLELSGETRPLKLLGWSVEKSVPHWIVVGSANDLKVRT